MPDNDETKHVLGLLLDAAEYEQTGEEAEEELLSEGVNVSGFLARVHEAAQKQQDEERLAWRRDARRNRDEFAKTQEVSAKYVTMTLAELRAEARKYAGELHFKGFEEATEDDLRTQLADHARLQELAKTKK